MGKHGTPEGLEELFERGLISLEEYADFWAEFWDLADEYGIEEIELSVLDAYLGEGENED